MSSPATSSGTEYQLKLPPDERSWTARENLTDILCRELLGPVNGPEELLETSPDIAYLVGRIAPARLTGRLDPQDADDDEAPFDVGDASDADQGRGVPVGTAEESGPDGDDDVVDDQPPKRGLMIPASMGLRFQLPLDVDRFTVTATWGTYRSVATEKVSRTGRPLRAYQRSHIKLPVIIETASLPPGKTSEVLLKDDVKLRIDTLVDPGADGEHHRRLVEIALCNDREVPRRIPANAWLFQTQLTVEAEGGAVFLPVTDILEDTYDEPDDELRRLNLLYRDRLEFAVGRTCSADWSVAEGARRATQVKTTWLPITETPQTQAFEITDAVLDMVALADPDTDLDAALRPIIVAYQDWLIRTQQPIAAALPEHLRSVAEDALEDAERSLTQLTTGLQHLIDDPEAQRCFRFMNSVMAEQRIQTQVADRRAKDPRLSRTAARQQVLAQDVGRAHTWRTFQLAFILMQLPGLTQPDHKRRSDPQLARVELLFFPTGGGKTEAYLGLAAYAFAIRRRQGRLDTPDGPLDGNSGVTVLMRYTLRLLTSQQFQRATALVCAAELIRRDHPETWGHEPFRIGLWVGTDVSPKRFEDAEEQLTMVNDGRSHRLTVLQVQRCPWCGTRIEPRNVKAIKAERRVHVYCGDDLAECPFSEGGAVPEGLPILTVDEEIYRLVPAFVIATVDKFARLAREGEAAALFGYVRKCCERHGYVHDDFRHCEIKDGGKHPRSGSLPAAAVRPVGRLRPPDLIIQDELHLITGALGTTVGLFEVAIDAVTSWISPAGKPVQPMIIASTATVRNAHDQIRSLYGRRASIFPPQVLDVADSFFAREVPVSEANPGRRYLGISTTGVRLTSAEIRVAEVAMSGAQLLLDRAWPGGANVDPYLTLVGYFNAIRELAGMSRYVTDDIQTTLRKGWPWSTLPRRYGTNFTSLRMAEMTSRIASAEITPTLDAMSVPFDPQFDSAPGRRELGAIRAAGRQVPTRETDPYDVVLATGMLQVGVDVPRLGLMMVVGQPKNTAEYIQASSRVGRQVDRPGLVISLGNWARPRDLAHFEQFRHYHETFYAQVEALSVTPFSITSIDRGLDGVLVAAARVLDAGRADGLSTETGAARVTAEQQLLDRIIQGLSRRAGRASDEGRAELVDLRLKNRLGQWSDRRAALAQQGKNLVYERITDESSQGPLMISAENATSQSGANELAPFVVANSMREVQPNINLLVSPIEERLFSAEPPGSPLWLLPEEDE